MLQDVQKFVGYSANWWAVALYKVLVLLTGGIVWILGQLCYHETVTLWLLQRCPLSGAQLVHVQVLFMLNFSAYHLAPGNISTFSSFASCSSSMGIGSL